MSQAMLAKADITYTYIHTQSDGLLENNCKRPFLGDVNKKPKFKETELLTEETNLVLFHFSKSATLLAVIGVGFKWANTWLTHLEGKSNHI